MTAPALIPLCQRLCYRFYHRLALSCLLAVMPAAAHAQTPPQPAQQTSQHTPAAAQPLPVTLPAPITPRNETQLPEGMTQHHAMGGITEYRLENGLRILLAPDAAQPSVTVNMTYLVGSRHESRGQTGMAHLLEHMLFRGTPSLRNALGEFSRRGLQANGTTSSDRTNYYATFTAHPDTLDWYLRWQADVMVNALIAREDLDAEMTVVRNEMEQAENSPFSVLLAQLRSAAYQWHNYGKSTLGARSDVEHVDIEQLRAFYHTWYQPNNAVLIVSGDFDPAQTLQSIHAAFAAIPASAHAMPREYTVEPVQDGERSVTLRRAGGTPIAAALYHVPDAANPHYPAVELGIAMLGDEPAGLLYRKLVETGLASDVFSFAADHKQPGWALLGAVVANTGTPDQALAVRDALRQLLDSLTPEDFQQDDLVRVRTQWLTGWEKANTNPAALASRLSEASALGDWRLHFLLRDRIAAVTLDDVRQHTLAYLVPDNRSTGLYLPTAQPQRAPALAHTPITAQLDGYTYAHNQAEVPAFDSSPANIEALTQRRILQLTQVDGNTGTLKLALLPKPTRGQLVSASLLMQFGDEHLLKGTQTAARAVASLLERGTQRLSRQQIEDQYTALQAQVTVSASAGQVQVNLSTKAEHLPALLALVLEILYEPAFPSEELEKYKRQITTSLLDARANPTSVAARALARHNNPWDADDVRYTPSFDEELARFAALTPEHLHAFHQRFYGAGSLIFSAVGQFDEDAVTQTLLDGIRHWRSAPAWTPIPRPYRDVPPQHFVLDTPDKANAFYLARQPVALQDTDPDYPALMIANYLLGGSETSMMWQRVREQEGLSYTVRSDLAASSREPSGSWTLYAIHAPDTSARLQAVFADILQTALEQGFSDEAVRQSVQGLLSYRKLNRSRDAVLAQSWVNYLALERTFAWSADMDAALEKLDGEAVTRALRQYLYPDQFSSALAADPGKRESK